MYENLHVIANGHVSDIYKDISSVVSCKNILLVTHSITLWWWFGNTTTIGIIIIIIITIIISNVKLDSTLVTIQEFCQ